ncbi:hypothetical protein VE03_03825 [Pseudogymnoascus sp. 23342-1-I1]|nr:hypothetical protein VE03_03825 [Pseudogymnoascus sp. 23342-1-I1]
MSDERTPLVASPKCPQGDPEAQSGREEEPSSKVDWVFLVIAQAGVFLAQADDSFVLSTHGEIASHFQRLSLGPWLVTAYNLGCCVALPMYGRLSYIYGYKVMLLSAYSLFAFGCAITGSSVSIWMAVAGRAIAGVGGSGMMDLISVMITDMAPLKDVALLRSYIVIAANVGVSVGAPLGGMLADVIGWRWSFLGQAPMAGLCFTMAVWRLPSKPRHQQVRKSGTNLTKQNPELDFFGICFLGITIAAAMGLAHLFGEGEFGQDQITAVLLAVVLVAGILFGLNEAFWTRDPLMPFWLLKTKGIGIVYIGQVLVEFSLFSLISNISEYFIRTENVTNSVAGSYLLFICFGALIGSLLYGKRIQQ